MFHDDRESPVLTYWYAGELAFQALRPVGTEQGTLFGIRWDGDTGEGVGTITSGGVPVGLVVRIARS
jgi:hypothetical protein